MKAKGRSAESEKFHVYRASDLPKPDNSHFLPCSLDMLYQVEPELKEIAARVAAHKRHWFYDWLDVYTAMKKEAEKLVG